MALIGTLRTKMTKWVVGFVALAIVSFILADLFGNSPTALFGGQDNSIGEIAGDKISMEEFQATVQNLEFNFMNQMGRQPNERDMIGLREQAWLLLIARHAIEPEYDKVGSVVTTEEMYDILQGKNIDEGIRQAFMDSTGAFDRKRLIEQLQAFAKAPAGSAERQQWDRIRDQFRTGRERVKYENLLVKTNYVTQAEAERQYHMDNDVSEIKYLFVPYFAVKDSALVTDADIKKYYEANKAKYKSEDTKSFAYVTFPIVASSADTVSLRTEMERFASDFHTSQDDSTFAALNTEGNSPFEKYNPNTLPSYINRETATKGLVLGPFINAGTYKVIKVSDITKDTIYQMKASHILFTWTENTPAAKKIAKDKAQQVLNEIKKDGTNTFAAKALQYSEDTQTKPLGGDLGWFPSSGQGSMVPEFAKPIKAATKTGLINDVIETDFGYHLINVTGTKDNTVFKIATIEKEIAASQETQDDAFRKADQFASDLEGVDDFKSRAEQNGLSIFDKNTVTSSDRYVGNLGDAREMITWLFREGKIGKVSPVWTLDRDYVVQIMTGESTGGTRPLDDNLKAEITAAVRKEKQGQAIIAKLGGEGSLEDLAKNYERDAIIGSASDVKLNSTNIANIGNDAVAIGKAFSVENGKRTKPFAGETGVTIIEVQNKTVAPAMGDYSIFKTQLLQNIESRGGLEIVEAIREKADIEDKRYKIY